MRIKLCAIFLLSVLMLLLSACPSGPPAQTPILISLSVPGAVPPDYVDLQPSASGSFSILPLFWSQTGVRVTNPFILKIAAPYPSALTVTVVDSAGTTVDLTHIDANAPQSSTGDYQVGDIDLNSNPPQWNLTLRLPDSVALKTALNIQIVDVSVNSNFTGQQLRSAPLNIPLVAMIPDYTLTIDVQGPGHIQSQPNGIICGANPLGGPDLSPCVFNFLPLSPPFPAPFPVKPVVLNPNSNQSAHFVGWAGACTGKSVCVVLLPGKPQKAVAMFAADTDNTLSVFGSCPVAPTVSGFVWKDVPACVDPLIKPTLSCDNKGYICCGPTGSGINTGRCAGAETNAQCIGTKLQLIQPGGCYARSSP